MTSVRYVCLSLLASALAIVPTAFGVTANDSLWAKFETTRQSSHTLHQEFEVSQRVKTGNVDHVSRHQVLLDIAEGKWREQIVGDEGDRTRLFDGRDVFQMEAGGTEYTRVKQKSEKDEQLPMPYETKLDWRKVKELRTLPCGFSGKDHTCVVIEAPMKPWARPGASGHIETMTGGTARVMIDTETGIWLRSEFGATIEGSYATSQWQESYTINQMSYGAPPNAALFKLPDNLHEVKEFKAWDETRIRKELVGKTAPDLHVTDIHGNAISLAAFKGKTVLLDFWTTWCPPCQADASSVEKLNQKYGSGTLAVIGISVGEERATVEQYLKKHPHNFPVVLSSENQMPPAYQIHVFPTYLIISPDGTLMTAQQGDQSFGKLRKDLEKAGMALASE